MLKRGFAALALAGAMTGAALAQASDDDFQMMSSIFVTEAVVQTCDLTIDKMVAATMQNDSVRLSDKLGMQPDMMQQSFDMLKKSVADDKSSCETDSDNYSIARATLARYGVSLD